MNEQTITPDTKEEYPLVGLPEAPASMNFYGVTKNGWNIQITLRDWNEHDMMSRFARFVGELASWGVTPKAVGQQPVNGAKATPEPAAPAAPPQEQHSDGVGVETFAADRLSVEIKDGKPYYKVIGSIFRKGVTIWPEALTASGFDTEKIPTVGLDLHGYTAYTVKKDPDDKWPSKVTKLVRA